MPKAIYGRISDDAAGLGLGVKRQEEDCRALAALRGWDIGRVAVDNDLSAFNTKVVRPEFERLLEDLETGVVDGVIAYDLDRFARQPADLERAIKIFDSRPGLSFATVQGDIDLSTPDGRTMARVMVAFANKSSMDTSRRLKRKMLELAREGRLHGATRPFGWEEDRVTVCEREASLIRQAAADIMNGISMHSIARCWNEQGVTTSTGGPWRQSTVRAMLVSPRIAGFQMHQRKIARDADGKPVMAKRPPVLDMATWEALCAFIQDPARTGPHTHPGGRKRLLSGLVRCGQCGARMTGGKNHRRPDEGIYVCKPATNNRGCGGIGVSGPRLDELITGLVLRYLADREVTHEIEAWPGEEDLVAISSRVTELMAAFSNGELSSDTVFPTIGKLEGEANRLRSDRAAWLREQVRLANQPTNAVETWPELNLEERRAVIEKVLQAVVVRPAEKKGGRFDPSRVAVVWR